MGGCSGWLRQEFRELEILDEINKLRYEKKLPNYIIGDRRNTIIREYQLWKGTNYVPKHVHAALCWSTDDPFPLLEVSRDTEWYIHMGLTDKCSINHNETQNKKMKVSHIERKSKRIDDIEDVANMPLKKQKKENTNPVGVQWNSTTSSCAYDALIMIMHS
ncbi:hypothetical protein K439DRAFT_1346443 [Ramaria rubella]|nr:hypothetical protein K439DRAFT_1346443 [Ramaria rubella]